MFIQGVIQGNAILKVYEDSTAATTAFEAIITVLVHCLFLVTSLVILRKKKLNEAIENQNK